MMNFLLQLVLILGVVSANVMEFELFANSSDENVDKLTLTAMSSSASGVKVYLSTDSSNSTILSYNSTSKVISFEYDQLYYLSLQEDSIVGLTTAVQNFTLNDTDNSLWSETGTKLFNTHLQLIESELNVNNVTYYPVNVNSTKSSPGNPIKFELIYKEIDTETSTSSAAQSSSTAASSHSSKSSSTKNEGNLSKYNFGPIMVAFFSMLM